VTPTASARLDFALKVLGPVQDIVDERVADERPPSWCERRGWTDFLLSLSDEDLRSFEARGLAIGLERSPNAPSDLRDLSELVTSAIALPMVQSRATLLPRQALLRVPARKREQLALLLGALELMATHCERVVDVGAGSGAFTRLSCRVFRREALGLERNAERVARASVCATEGDAASVVDTSAEFLVHDVFRDGLELAPGDLVVGLHACGELGDALVRAAAQSGCDTALISCCLQKIQGPVRHPLSRAAAGTTFARGILGLTNQVSRAMGVEDSLEQTLAARQVRYALGGLLRGRGVELEPGAEMRGINRRLAHQGLRVVAGKALAQRGLAPPNELELAHHERTAAAAFAKVRRLALPRNMLARLVEVSIALDRAAHLEEHGLRTEVATLFDRDVSPRNLAIFASHDASRLPSGGSCAGPMAGSPPPAPERNPCAG
jgi:hypothetical protein